MSLALRVLSVVMKTPENEQLSARVSYIRGSAKDQQKKNKTKTCLQQQYKQALYNNNIANKMLSLYMNVSENGN